MKTTHFRMTPLRVMLLTFTILLLSLILISGRTAQAGAGETIAPKWTHCLPQLSCGGGDGPNDHRPSPAIADINNDGQNDIVVATSNGWVVALQNSGSRVLWQRNLAADFGMNGGQVITAAPAVADVDEDGRLEVVVATGTLFPNVCTQGGVIVLEHDGSVKNGWPFLADDYSIAPSGCRDTVFSTPALGDLDNDGDLEIVFGGFDKTIRALHHTGQHLPGFPINSYHRNRFLWPTLVGRTADTVWSSPSLADVNGDGFLDILIGTDEGNYDSSHRGNANGWSCPFTPPIVAGYCGGSLYVIDRFGNHLPGFPNYILEHIQSAPAVQDVNGDGLPEIFVGTGTFYHLNSPERPTNGFRLFGWDSNGNDLPGWSGGKVLGGGAPASPALGDIDGDGEPEVVIMAMDRELYAFNMNGTAVSGFPMTPLTQTGVATQFNAGRGAVLGDYDGDGDMEIFLSQSWTVTIVDGDGTQLTTTQLNPINAQPADGKPMYFANGNMNNNPALGDVDNDGQLELVVHNNRVTVWDLPNGAEEADWPQYRNNAARIGTANVPTLLVTPGQLFVADEVGGANTINVNMRIQNGGTESVSWSATSSDSRVTFVGSTSGSVEQNSDILAVRINTGGLSAGVQQLGTIRVTGTSGGDSVANSPMQIEVRVLMANDLSQLYLPFVKK